MVNEKQTAKEDDTGPENKPVNNDDGDASEGQSLVEKARQTAERIENANIRTEAALAKMEDIEAKRILGGRGIIVGQEPKKEVSDLEYAKALLTGKILK